MKKLTFLLLVSGCLLSCDYNHTDVKQISSIEGNWIWQCPDSDHIVVISSDKIMLSERLICQYNIENKGILHIKRMWLEEGIIGYEANCKYKLNDDTLFIDEMMPTIANVYPPKYESITLIRNKNAITTGEIVGKIGCYVENNSEMYKGLFIVTNNNDSLLAFNISDENIDVQYGCYGILSKTMPYKFTFRYLSPTDSEYVHYIMPLSNAMLPGIDAERFKQAIIIKHN